MPQTLFFHTGITVGKKPRYHRNRKQIADIQRLILLPMLKTDSIKPFDIFDTY